jgi:hypothetical protein
LAEDLQRHVSERNLALLAALGPSRIDNVDPPSDIHAAPLHPHQLRVPTHPGVRIAYKARKASPKWGVEAGKR